MQQHQKQQKQDPSPILLAVQSDAVDIWQSEIKISMFASLKRLYSDTTHSISSSTVNRGDGKRFKESLRYATFLLALDEVCTTSIEFSTCKIRICK